MKYGLIKTALFTAAGAALVKLSKKSIDIRRANSDIYQPSRDFFVDDNLNGKKIVFLGSMIKETVLRWEESANRMMLKILILKLPSVQSST